MHLNKPALSANPVTHTKDNCKCDRLASHGQCSSDVSCCRVEERTEDELYCIISLHPIIIHCHVSVETWAGVDVEIGAGARVGGSVSSIYNVSNAQTVESALVTSRHPETQSRIHFWVSEQCLYRCTVCVCVHVIWCEPTRCLCKGLARLDWHVQ